MIIKKYVLIRLCHLFDTHFYIKNDLLANIIEIKLDTNADFFHDYMPLYDISVSRNHLDFIDAICSFRDIDHLDLILYLMTSGEISYDF